MALTGRAMQLSVASRGCHTASRRALHPRPDSRPPHYALTRYSRSLAPPSALVYLKMDVLDASDHAVGPPHFKAEPDARFADDDGAGGTLKLLHGARYALRLKLEPDRLEPAGSGVEVWAEDELVCALPLVRGRCVANG